MAGTNNTAFSPNADFLAQISGSGAPIAGSVVATYVSGGNTDISALMQVSRFAAITTASGNSTVITTAVLRAGAQFTAQVNNDATAARTVTFGTGFRPTGTVVGTNSKAILVQFISDGLTLNEVARSVSALT